MRTKDLIILALLGINTLLLGWLIHRTGQLEMLTLESAARGGPRPGDSAQRRGDPYRQGAVANTIRKKAGEIQRCYNEFIARTDGPTDGDIQMDWRIQSAGAGESAGRVKSGFGDDALFACMSGRINAWDFPPPPFERPYYVSHTFSFRKVTEQD